MAIYKTDLDDTWVIASGGLWLPGGYDTAATARYAFQFSNKELIELCDMANARGGKQQITLDDLRAKRKARI